MEIKRCLLTKTTNDSTFAIYPKTSADLVVLDQNTEEKLIDRLNNNGIWQNKTFYQGPKVAKGTVGAGNPNIDIANIGGSWWAQTKGGNYGTAPSLIVHQRRLIEQKDNDNNRTVSPTIRLQNYITYNHNGNPTTNNGVTTYKGEHNYENFTGRSVRQSWNRDPESPLRSRPRSHRGRSQGEREQRARGQIHLPRHRRDQERDHERHLRWSRGRHHDYGPHHVFHEIHRL